jgi:uroporphyrin-III C-methyltransferase
MSGFVSFVSAGPEVSVVRLKSGDAGIFGRLEEELDALASAGVAYEIIPGVTAACAAAALSGLPLTRRHTAPGAIITGADVKGELPEDLNWAALADPHAMTALYMGKRTVPVLAARLLAQGMSPDTPTLLAESIGHPINASSARRSENWPSNCHGKM